MKIAIPVTGDVVSVSLEASTGIVFYEDDHGRIVRREHVGTEGGFDAALSLLERRGVDALVCGTLPPEEKQALALSGLLLSQDFGGAADDAARAYLDRTIASDPNNTCHRCGF